MTIWSLGDLFTEYIARSRNPHLLKKIDVPDIVPQIYIHLQKMLHMLLEEKGEYPRETLPSDPEIYKYICSPQLIYWHCHWCSLKL